MTWSRLQFRHIFGSRYILQISWSNGNCGTLWSRPILDMGRRVGSRDITCHHAHLPYTRMSYAMLLRNLLLGIYYKKGGAAMNGSAVQQTYRSKGKLPQSKLTLPSQSTFFINIRPFLCSIAIILWYICVFPAISRVWSSFTLALVSYIIHILGQFIPVEQEKILNVTFCCITDAFIHYHCCRYDGRRCRGHGWGIRFQRIRK